MRICAFSYSLYYQQNDDGHYASKVFSYLPFSLVSVFHYFIYHITFRTFPTKIFFMLPPSSVVIIIITLLTSYFFLSYFFLFYFWRRSVILCFSTSLFSRMIGWSRRHFNLMLAQIILLDFEIKKPTQWCLKPFSQPHPASLVVVGSTLTSGRLLTNEEHSTLTTALQVRDEHWKLSVINIFTFNLSLPGHLLLRAFYMPRTAAIISFVSLFLLSLFFFVFQP